jgi:putative membrane protein
VEPTPAARREKNIFRVILFFSVVVFVTIAVLSRVPKADHIPAFVRWLPAFNATINGTTAVLLLFSLYFIRRKRVAIHKRINITCFVLSGLFLVSYVTWHAFGVETRFPADHPWRTAYLVILVSHILLAAVVFPLVLVSFYFGLTNQVRRHRRIVRWSFPVWLYVAVTGVVVYLMISPYYRF